ncbi:MAG: 23S rRNA (adenine(2030)-N(6))-methyltransferase RlmJ [Myxococcota bacterium]|nr:23S rRNA (adenine(2030)-N(6))-methyltransferase RlmJ [Myxococcota bacterium]
MLSYRHGYHAGNFADVLKHSILLEILSLIQNKEKPFVYIDTHAGAGGYSLSHEYAQKTKEYETGIKRLREAEQAPPKSMQSYLNAVSSYADEEGKGEHYPGSPWLAVHTLRKQDGAFLFELHKNEYSNLRSRFDDNKRVKLANRNGLEGLLSVVPPVQRRAVILIDPSYEDKSEYHQLVRTISQAHRKFATGRYVLWYPVVDRQMTDSMISRFRETGIKRQLRIEHCIAADTKGLGMTGSGLLVINPPWNLDETAREIISYVGSVFGSSLNLSKVRWEVGE